MAIAFALENVETSKGTPFFKNSATLLLVCLKKTQCGHEMKPRYKTWLQSLDEKNENGYRTWMKNMKMVTKPGSAAGLVDRCPLPSLK